MNRFSVTVSNGYRLHHAALPRKLMVNKKVESYEAKGLVTTNEQSKPSSGESHKNGEEIDVIVHAAKGTRQEWIEGSDPTHEFFTMDYSHVRRRRPIHNNKQEHPSIKKPLASGQHYKYAAFTMLIAFDSLFPTEAAVEKPAQASNPSSFPQSSPTISPS
ncbi:hypothetical protein L2E82_44680 [Cichorium intybus]|uniref:Uncharacterized protein n=1 Tax=Cichorium intybus TaxID=13427 RepID=A0ACB8ZRS8_CICIN|nr:hypothetical protein L2E82_44680 [Cichorium intybus]